MRSILTAVLVSTILTGLAGQRPTYRVAETPGVLVAGDFDADGFDDVLVLGISGVSRTYMGDRLAPYLRKGPFWMFDNVWTLLDVPVFVGGYLYVPVATRVPGRADVRIYRMVQRVWRGHRTLAITPPSPLFAIDSLRLTALHRDVDGDRRRDVIAAWGQLPLLPTSGFHVAYLSPTGIVARTAIPPLPGQTARSVVVDIHPARKLVPTPAPEYLVTLSANQSNPAGGFGFLTIQAGPKVGPGVWATGGPPLAYAKFLHVDSAVSYVDSNVLPTVRTPLVQLATGESVLFMPWVTAPYVTNQGEYLATTRRSLWLDRCVADFDGDGRDEAVLVESIGQQHLGHLFVGDPSRRRTWSQYFPIDTGAGRLSVFHGATGDFDGDGDPDLLINLYQSGMPRDGFFALFRTDRRGGKGKPALRREY